VLPTLLLYWFTGLMSGSDGVVVGAPIVMVGLGVLCAVWSLALRVKRVAPAHVCPSCGYDLTGLPEETGDARVCPECGHTRDR
jgi:predicted RNA-binding Zn-ribbon protein involved in translation (DUF1610 family)